MFKALFIWLDQNISAWTDSPLYLLAIKNMFCVFVCVCRKQLSMPSSSFSPSRRSWRSLLMVWWCTRTRTYGTVGTCWISSLSSLGKSCCSLRFISFFTQLLLYVIVISGNRMVRKDKNFSNGFINRMKMHLKSCPHSCMNFKYT